MGIDTHIKFDGVDGESMHKDHKGEIELLKWRWMVSNDSAVMGGGSGKGKAEPGKFSIWHNYDKSSPVLAKRCADGKHFPTVTLTARKSGEGQKDFLKITFKEVFINKVETEADPEAGIIEQVVFSYGDMEKEYKAQDDKGNPGGAVKFGWNVKTSEFR